jgi:hypothetical protein
MTGLDSIKSKSLPSKYKPGQRIGTHTLVAPRGNPELGPPLWWDRECGHCASIVPVATGSIPELEETKGCKICKFGRSPNPTHGTKTTPS